METRDTDIGMGDVVRAWIELGAGTAEERALIASLLGFHYTFKGGERRPRARKPDVSTAAAASTSPEGHSKAADSATGSDLSVPLPLARIAERAAPPEGAPDWLRVDRPLEPELPRHLHVRPALQPLFRARWTRAILSAACATASPDGPIDVQRLVQTLARCRPVTTLPREPTLSLGRGIELLVDRGENLMPFTRDIRDLQQQMQLVVGRDRTRIRYFDGCPTLGCGPGARSTWRTPYKPPAAETPIVVITDLGMARGAAARTSATEDSWLNFFRIARSASCPVVVFSPYPLSRWPVRLSKEVRAISWDRSTTVSIARQAAPRRGDLG